MTNKTVQTMSRRLYLLGISGLTICASCGFPRPPDISPDGGPVSQFPASNAVTRADLAAGIAPLVVPAGATFVIDTDQGSMFDAKNGNVPIRVAGPGVKNGVFYRSDDQNRAFFAVQSLILGERAILRGVGTRALIFVADGPIEIHGILDVSAGHCSITADEIDCAGPGGGRGGTGSAAPMGCSPGETGDSEVGAAGGSGGGGFGSPGGAGGVGAANGTFQVLGGAGGSGTGCVEPTLDPLQGGSGGPRGGGEGIGRPGGGGGGALQVTSYTSIALVSPTAANTGGMWAGGSGGGGGAPGGSGPVAGSGGGAGGAILLEAPSIEIASGVVLAANGGGGGAGELTIDGQPGQFGNTPAAGGTGSSGVAGGAGAAGNANALDGGPGVAVPEQSGPAGGGGGGGIGHIRINAIVLNLSDQAVLSPNPSVNMLSSG